MPNSLVRLVSILSLSGLASCAHIVEIVEPSADGCPGDAQPIPLISVRFHQRYEPGSLSAVLRQQAVNPNDGSVTQLGRAP
jgi:hypothetical protein